MGMDFRSVICCTGKGSIHWIGILYNYNNKLEEGTICGGGVVFTQLQNQLGGRSEHCVLSCSFVLSKSPQLHRYHQAAATLGQ
jgi:hypothetical protein